MFDARGLSAAAAAFVTAGGLVSLLFTGSPGSSATTAPTANTRTMASVSNQAPAPKIACYFEVNSSGQVVAPPALQAFETNTNDKEHCVIRMGSQGSAAFVEVVTPTYQLGTFGVGNGYYPLQVVPNSMLKGSTRLYGQPKNGYNLQCQTDARGHLVPARPGLHSKVRTCKAVGRYFSSNALGIGFKLTSGGKTTVLKIGKVVKHPGLLHLIFASLHPAP